MRVWKDRDYVGIFDGIGWTQEALVQAFEICDDCREAYPPPVFYTFDVDSCSVFVDNVPEPHDCTGNLCPDCSGYLIPDDPNDPRATPEQRQQAKDLGFT